MNAITGLTDQACQQFNLPLPDGTQATMILSFRPNQQGWYYDLSWNGTPAWNGLGGQRLVAGPNIIRQFRTQITFGLGCITEANVDPMTQDAFINGTATMLVLSADDVAQIEAELYPGH